jgi:hypothetical protein
MPMTDAIRLCVDRLAPFRSPSIATDPSVPMRPPSCAVVLYVTGYKLLFDDWRGFFVAGFSLVWVANVYMTLFGRLRLEIREERLEIAAAEADNATRPKK